MSPTFKNIGGNAIILQRSSETQKLGYVYVETVLKKQACLKIVFGKKDKQINKYLSLSQQPTANTIQCSWTVSIAKTNKQTNNLPPFQTWMAENIYTFFYFFLSSWKKIIDHLSAVFLAVSGFILENSGPIFRNPLA